MSEYTVEPEVAGGFGPQTVLDASVHPPRVDQLDYEFAGWLGDDIVETFPCFVVTQRLAEALERERLSGFALAPVIVSAAPDFAEHRPEPLPEFVWLRVDGTQGDDLRIGQDLMLHVSDRALAVLTSLSLTHAVVEQVA